MIAKIFSEFANSLFKSHPSFNFIRKYSTHYDVLNLPRNCTKKQIKESFIKLSKENHPDVNKCALSHSKILKINEAYRVLSNESMRRTYDLGLSYRYTGARNATNVHSSPWNDPFYYNPFEYERTRRSKPYYGIKGVNRVPNYVIASITVALASLFLFLEVLAIRHSFTFKRDVLLQKSAEATETLNKMKKMAHDNGNEVQIELLRQKFAELEKSK